MDCVNRDMRAERRNMRSMTELAGGGMRLPQRPHNQVGAARGRRVSLSSAVFIPSSVAGF